MNRLCDSVPPLFHIAAMDSGYSILGCKIDNIRLLVDAGADLEWRDDRGRTALVATSSILLDSYTETFPIVYQKFLAPGVGRQRRAGHRQGWGHGIALRRRMLGPSRHSSFKSAP